MSIDDNKALILRYYAHLWNRWDIELAESLIASDLAVVARLEFRGTHKGTVFGVSATGRRVAYAGVAIFHIAGGKIPRGWVLGDTLSLRRQLEADAADR